MLIFAVLFLLPGFGSTSGQIAFAYGCALAAAALVAHRYVKRVDPPAALEAGAQDLPESDATLATVVFDGDNIASITGHLPDGLFRDMPFDLQCGHLSDFLGSMTAAATPIREPLELLVAHGVGFVEVLSLPDGSPVRVTGKPRALRVDVRFEPASEHEILLYTRLQNERRNTEELIDFRLRAEVSPVASYELAADGQPTWQNAAAEALFGPLARTGTGMDRPAPAADDLVQLRSAEGHDRGWARVMSHDIGSGRKLVFVSDADDQVKAEESLKSFVSTMTETFAHLDLGLAIFDREKRLSLFNPALCDLFGLDAAQLATRPSLRSFLEDLRQRRMVPEQRDFTKWRQAFAALAGEGGQRAYAEDWTLPSGQILRVTGRPHPKGATAYIFEDISGHVMLERRYVAEMELGQSTLDQLEDGVAVLSISGEILLSNHAFEQMWAIGLTDTLDRRDISALCDQIAAMPDGDRVAQGIMRSVLDSNVPRQGVFRLRLPDGGERVLQLKPLGGGTTLFLCKEEAPAGDRVSLLAELDHQLQRHGLRGRLDHGSIDQIQTLSERGAIWSICQVAGSVGRPSGEVLVHMARRDGDIRIEASIPIADGDQPSLPGKLSAACDRIERLGFAARTEIGGTPRQVSVLVQSAAPKVAKTAPMADRAALS